MSQPNIPDINPIINLDREDVINLLLASIALEEMGLAHIVNSEAEKIQYILGTIEGLIPPEVASLTDLLSVNDSVGKVLRSVIKKEMLLQFKLEDILDSLPTTNIFSNIATVEGFFNETAFTDSDIAFYNTGGNQ